MIRIQVLESQDFEQWKRGSVYMNAIPKDHLYIDFNLDQARKLWRAIGKELKEAKERQRE